VTITIRPAAPADLSQLAEIEASADALFADVFGPLDATGVSWSPESGEERAAATGFILVAAHGPAEVVGFVHVLEAAGHAHLEQLSVRPTHARRGIGRALVASAVDGAAQRGYRRITLRTFADVPWNAPFYAACGFTVTPTSDDAFHRSLVETERRLGLHRLGERVEMTRTIA